MISGSPVEVEKYSSGKLELRQQTIPSNSRLTINDFDFVGTSPDTKGDVHWENVLRDLVRDNPDKAQQTIYHLLILKIWMI